VTPRWVVGVGLSTTASPRELADLVDTALADALVPGSEVHTVATLEARHDHPAVVALGWPVLAFPAELLATVDVPTPSGRVTTETGTPSVAEAAALLGAGEGAELVVAKRTSAHAAVALARATTAAPTSHLPNVEPRRTES
jgi:cobalamin biosynthesis protein CbiG